MPKVKILVVEDELIIAQDISFQLEDVGYEVVEMATSYDEAIAAIKEHEPNLVLLDIEILGDKDGVDVAMYIRENTSLPFLFLTSNADFSTVARAKAARPNGYLMKPLKKNDIFTSVEVALANNEAVQATAKSDDDDTIFVQQEDGLVKMKQSDILWLKAGGNYTEVHTAKERLLVRGNIKDTHNRLNENFYRVQKSYVVNLKAIDRIQHAFVTINETEIPVGQKFREGLLSRINKL